MSVMVDRRFRGRGMRGVSGLGDDCPAGLGPLWTMGGPICAKIYAATDALPPGCDNAADITSIACHPELHASFDLPGGATANDGWHQATDGSWYWNGPGAAPSTPPPNPGDLFRPADAAAQAAATGAVTAYVQDWQGNVAPVSVAVGAPLETSAVVNALTASAPQKQAIPVAAATNKLAPPTGAPVVTAAQIKAGLVQSGGPDLANAVGLTPVQAVAQSAAAAIMNTLKPLLPAWMTAHGIVDFASMQPGDFVKFFHDEGYTYDPADGSLAADTWGLMSTAFTLGGVDVPVWAVAGVGMAALFVAMKGK